MIKGTRPDNSLFEAAMKACEKAVAENPELCILYDLESGFPYLADEKQRQALIEVWESCRPKATREFPVGGIIYFGTKGDI